jgi:hypothetical protein
MKDQSEILPWISDIVNHFWYCAKQASSVDEFKVCFWEVNRYCKKKNVCLVYRRQERLFLFLQLKWHAVIHHVRNQHTWATGSCEHGPLGDGNQEKTWIEQGISNLFLCVALYGPLSFS